MSHDVSGFASTQQTNEDNADFAACTQNNTRGSRQHIQFSHQARGPLIVELKKRRIAH